MTKSVYLPPLEPSEFELLQQVLYSFIGDVSYSNEIKQQVTEILVYIKTRAVRQ